MLSCILAGFVRFAELYNHFFDFLLVTDGKTVKAASKPIPGLLKTAFNYSFLAVDCNLERLPVWPNSM